MPDTDRTSTIPQEQVHDEVLKLLPWYHNGTLSESEIARVEPHLADCDRCQNELVRCSEINEAVGAERESDWQPGEPDLDRMLERIATLEPKPSPPRSERIRMREIWPLLPSPVRWGLVGQTLVTAGLAALLFWPSTPEPSRGASGMPARFETLTTPTNGPTSAGTAARRIQIIFAEGATESDLRSLLLNVRGTIIAGPSKRGVYELILEKPDSFDTQLARLRGDARVRFAEALPGGALP